MGQIRTAVSAPVLINLGAVRWQISPAQIEKMLVYPHGGQRHLSIASDKASTYLSVLSKDLDKPARERVVRGLGPRACASSRRARARRSIAKRTAAAILSAALNPDDRIATVVMKTTPPKRTTAQAQAMGITGLVGHYETSFSGTANRIHNVELVARLIDNKFIAPGAVFSFNQTTGERNAKKGFLHGAGDHQRRGLRRARRRRLPGFDDRVQRCFRGRARDRGAHQPRALHQPLPARARRHGELARAPISSSGTTPATGCCSGPSPARTRCWSLSTELLSTAGSYPRRRRCTSPARRR